VCDGRQGLSHNPTSFAGAHDRHGMRTAILTHKDRVRETELQRCLAVRVELHFRSPRRLQTHRTSNRILEQSNLKPNPRYFNELSNLFKSSPHEPFGSSHVRLLRLLLQYLLARIPNSSCHSKLFKCTAGLSDNHYRADWLRFAPGNFSSSTVHNGCPFMVRSSQAGQSRLSNGADTILVINFKGLSRVA
jgi:hypothetical protein